MKKIVVLLIILALCASFLVGQSIGDKAVDFTAQDINGTIVKLFEMSKEKVILLDFWATWCGPCRREIPHLIEIKKEFKNKNFEIISIDGFERRGDEPAKKFVRDNRMNWVHIIDQKVGYAISKKYGVRGIPAMFIIENGKILAANLRGDQLKLKLRELLK